MTTYEHVLHGCAPVPLAGYLKALGLPLGLLINFKVAVLRDGIKRVILT